MPIIKVIIAFVRDPVITTIFSLLILNQSLWLSKFSFMFPLCFQCYKYPYWQTALFFQSTSAFWHYQLDPYLRSSLQNFSTTVAYKERLKLKLIIICLFMVQKSHMKIWRVLHACIQMNSYIYKYSMCKMTWKKICWLLSPSNNASFLSVMNLAEGKYDEGKGRLTFFLRILL